MTTILQFPVIEPIREPDPEGERVVNDPSAIVAVLKAKLAAGKATTERKASNE